MSKKKEKLSAKEAEARARREMERLEMELGGGNIIETAVVNHKRRMDCYSEDEYELEMDRYDSRSVKENEVDWMPNGDE